MLKIIKKTISFLIIPVAVFVLVPVVLLIMFRIPYIQTGMVRGFTKYISGELNTTISIGKIEFSYFNKLIITEILIKDQNHDTLVYSPGIVAGIRKLDPLNGVITFGRVSVTKPVFALITDSTGLMNLTWYLDKITSKRDSSKNQNSVFRINRIDIDDGRFAMINYINEPSNIPVNFNNLRVSGINGSIEDLVVINGSVTLGILNLSLNESNGFAVKKMDSKLLINGPHIIFSDVAMICDSSIIKASHIGLFGDSINMFSRFIEEVKLDININKSSVSSSDLKYFIPFLNDFHESFLLSGRVTGTVAELKGRNIMISYGDITELDCDFDLSGLPDIGNTFIFLELNNFRSESGDIERITLPGRGKLELPEPLKNLGIISFSGTFTGFTTDFVTYGILNTSKGIISTDVSLRPEGRKRFRVNGLIKGTDIDLGSLSGNEKLLGKMTVAVNLDGFTDSFKTFDAELTGKIDSVEINSYTYRNIDLKGSFSDKAWDGRIRIEDKNLIMELLGMFDFNGELPEFDFTMNLKKANLYKLNIDKSDTSSAISVLLTANLKGNNIDNLDGEIKLLNSKFRRYQNDLEVYDFSLRTFIQNSKPAILLRTDFIDAGIYGNYSFAGLRNIIRNAIGVLIPAKYSEQKVEFINDENDFIFDIKFRNTERLNSFLNTGLTISENSFINGGVISDSLIYLAGNAKTFSFGNNTLSDLTFDIRFSDSVLNTVVKSRSLSLSGISDLKDINLNLEAMPDSFNFGLLWDNKEKLLNKGTFLASGTFKGTPEKKEKAVLNIKLLPGEIYSRNNLWKIQTSEISVDSNAVRFDMFSIRNNDNYILIDGSMSEDPADTISLKFNGINLSPLNNLYEKRMGNQDDIIHLAIGGTLNGRVSLTNIYRNFMFESDLRLKDFSLLESSYGEIKIISVWNNVRKVVDIFASNDLGGVRMFNITGTFNPGTRKIDLIADADKLPIDALNPLLQVFASDISGSATGRVNLTGVLDKPVLTGALLAENASMKIDYVQSRYSFTDSISFDKDGINFNNVEFRDERGNLAYLDGKVYHQHFKDFNVDLTLRTNDFMVLNTRPKDNEMFYGTAYASGLTTLKSSGSLLRFDISAKTGKNTRFYIPLNTGLSVTENTFITFIPPAADDSLDATDNKNKTTGISSTAIEIAFDLDITPEAEIQLIMDPKTGDIMKGTGSGNLNINLDRKSTLKIFGDYTIENGSYLFTLGNIINKPFDVENGGQITFNGDVDDAEINIKAIYKTKASLYEIMPELITDEKQKERIPVECQLLLTGRLFNPMVGFDIYLPTADEETRAYLKSMIKSDEDMSRQFLFLLVMGSFYADQSSSSSPNIGSSAVGLTTMEMVSNQLSNWLSQISNEIDIGVAYRPGSSNLSNSDELQVALSTQLLNDRVIINGNFDVEGIQATESNQSAAPGTSTFTGAFDIEYKINEKIRFKFFNRSNDNFYTDNGIQYTQGIGLFYREEFNKLKDLFMKKEKGDIKKEKEPDQEKD